MKVIRPILPKDQAVLESLADAAGIGITSLPKDAKLLAKKVEESLEAFAETTTNPHHYHYLFVLEDLKTGKVEGTSAIQAKTGVPDPVVYYKLEKVPTPIHDPKIPENQILLNPVFYHDGPTEICGLFLSPEARKEGFGRLLSYSRFLFMASHPYRFSPYIVAAMRGFIDENNRSPVWETIGKHFYNASLEEAFQLCIRNRAKMTEILPSHPIYISLLPEEIQKLLGSTHPHTKPALKLLLEEGFKDIKEVDIIDGGPKIGAKLHSISTFKNSQSSTVAKIVDKLPTKGKMLISNESLNFRATIHSAFEEASGEIKIEKELAEALEVNVGDCIRWVQLGEKNDKA